jgi:hypothetical protein
MQIRKDVDVIADISTSEWYRQAVAAYHCPPRSH